MATVDEDVTERITVTWQSDDPLVRAALADHRDMIAGEVLATSVDEAPGGEVVDLVGRAAHLAVSRG